MGTNSSVRLQKRRLLKRPPRPFPRYEGFATRGNNGEQYRNKRVAVRYFALLLRLYGSPLLGRGGLFSTF